MKAICTTTIHPPSDALRAFAEKKDWQLVIAGDLRTPDKTYLDGSSWIYLSAQDQTKIDPALSEAIGWNCIQRRNFAFLFAMKELRADMVATIDDDNLPMDSWGENIVLPGTMACDYYETSEPAFDPLCATGASSIWHRGFPLELISGRLGAKVSTQAALADVRADLWNGDPDIDAICRLIYAPKSVFDRDKMVASNAPSPFNSQNTFLSARIMPEYFMFPHVGRWDDICAAYHVQAMGHKVVYGPASVTQVRNQHDLMRDMRNEYWGYENTMKMVLAIRQGKQNAVLDLLPQRSLDAFRLYQKHYE